MTFSPAAANTLLRYFKLSGTTPENYDAIFTGDLGAVGSTLLYQLLQEQKIDITARHKDCGLMLFNRNRQDVHAGGSGCGCSASVLCGHILKELEQGNLKNALFCATGALLSPVTVAQKQSVPCIAHLVQLKALYSFSNFTIFRLTNAVKRQQTARQQNAAGLLLLAIYCTSLNSAMSHSTSSP